MAQIPGNAPRLRLVYSKTALARNYSFFAINENRTKLYRMGLNQGLPHFQCCTSGQACHAGFAPFLDGNNESGLYEEENDAGDSFCVINRRPDHTPQCGAVDDDTLNEVEDNALDEHLWGQQPELEQQIAEKPRLRLICSRVNLAHQFSFFAIDWNGQKLYKMELNQQGRPTFRCQTSGQVCIQTFRPFLDAQNGSGLYEEEDEDGNVLCVARVISRHSEQCDAVDEDMLAVLDTNQWP